MIAQAELPGVARRFLAFLAPSPDSSCIVFTGAHDHKGYGNFHLGGSKPAGTRRMVKAHRFSLWLFRGITPRPGQQIHHRCGWRDCCNPYHIEALSESAHRAEHASVADLPPIEL